MKIWESVIKNWDSPITSMIFSISVRYRHPGRLSSSTSWPIRVSTHLCALSRDIKNAYVVTVVRDQNNLSQEESFVARSCSHWLPNSFAAINEVVFPRNFSFFQIVFFFTGYRWVIFAAFIQICRSIFATENGIENFLYFANIVDG